MAVKLSYAIHFVAAQGVRFTGPPTPEHGITLAEFVDSEGARCSVSG